MPFIKSFTIQHFFVIKCLNFRSDQIIRIAWHRRRKQGGKGAVAPLDFWFN